MENINEKSAIAMVGNYRGSKLDGKGEKKRITKDHGGVTMAQCRKG